MASVSTQPAFAKQLDALDFNRDIQEVKELIDDDDNFVQFIDRNIAAPIEQKTKEYSGLALDLNFHVTSDANMKLIFNDQTGDEIIAKGAGDLNIKLDQFNQLTMNGPYVISGGSRYNFALGSIKQTFDIESGSKIEWTGDPYNADISINTVTPKRASILELSPEIQDNTLVNQEILCYLKLSETLLQPKITFDLIAPRTTETGKALIDRVKTDPDELNRQFLLNARPVGEVKLSDLRYHETSVPDLKQGEFLVLRRLLCLCC